jgi:hypothetical protein
MVGASSSVYLYLCQCLCCNIVCIIYSPECCPIYSLLC